MLCLCLLDPIPLYPLPICLALVPHALPALLVLTSNHQGTTLSGRSLAFCTSAQSYISAYTGCWVGQRARIVQTYVQTYDRWPEHLEQASDADWVRPFTTMADLVAPWTLLSRRRVFPTTRRRNLLTKELEWMMFGKQNPHLYWRCWATQ